MTAPRPGHTAPDLPVLRATIAPAPGTAEALFGRRVYAFAGIGRPEKVRRTLVDLGAEVVGWRAFGDHQPLFRAALEDMLAETESSVRWW